MTFPTPASTTPQPEPDCCAPSAQATCCEPSAKPECCGTAASAPHASAPDDSACGCSEGSAHAGDVSTPAATPTNPTDLRETVRAKYAFAAQRVLDEGASACCSGSGILTDVQQAVFGEGLYDDAHRDAPSSAVLASLGCGNPTAVASLAPGETVLDLGSGGGLDVLLSARRVGPTGKAYGLDMTDEMLELARRNQAEAGITNAEFLKGAIEALPLPDASVDVIISNCVINLSGDKPQVLREAMRVLRPGGRFAVSDVIADPTMDDATRASVQQWTGCIAGALTEAEFSGHLAAAGFVDISIEETHRVHDHAYSAIVRATKPA